MIIRKLLIIQKDGEKQETHWILWNRMVSIIRSKLCFIRAIKFSQRKNRLYPSSQISGNLNIFKIFDQLIINVLHLTFMSWDLNFVIVDWTNYYIFISSRQFYLDLVFRHTDLLLISIGNLEGFLIDFETFDITTIFGIELIFYAWFGWFLDKCSLAM